MSTRFSMLPNFVSAQLRAFSVFLRVTIIYFAELRGEDAELRRERPIFFFHRFAQINSAKIYEILRTNNPRYAVNKCTFERKGLSMFHARVSFYDEENINF